MSKKPVRGLSATMLQPQPSPDTPEVLSPPVLALATDPASEPPRGAAPPQALPVDADSVGPSTQTVKVPHHDFVRLKTLSARSRRRHQDIILTALREYLEKHNV